jgi:anti-sigma regulatory factor (Ser/Thr protein kinase)
MSEITCLACGHNIEAHIWDEGLSTDACTVLGCQCKSYVDQDARGGVEGAI